MGNRFREAVRDFAESRGIPILRLKKPDRSRWDDRKLDHVRPYLERASAPGVVAIVVAQEFQWVFTGYNRATKPGAVNFDFTKAERRVSTYYFYVLDEEFGSGLHQDLQLLPLPGQGLGERPRVGQAPGKPSGISPTASWPTASLPAPSPSASRRSATASDAADLQALLRPLAGRHPDALLADADREAGYWWELSMRQVEVSRTIVLDDPRRARAFFESLVADNIGIGRPDQVAAVFARRVQKNTPGIFRTRVFARRHRGEDRLPLQAQPGQAVPQGRAGRSASRPSSTIPPTSASSAASSICPSCRRKRAPSITVCL